MEANSGTAVGFFKHIFAPKESAVAKFDQILSLRAEACSCVRSVSNVLSAVRVVHERTLFLTADVWYCKGIADTLPMAKGIWSSLIEDSESTFSHAVG